LFLERCAAMLTLQGRFDELGQTEIVITRGFGVHPV